MANVRDGSWTVASEVYFYFNFAVVFDFNRFPVPLSKAKSIGDVPMNRSNAAIRSMVFFLSPNHPALLGNVQGR
jgi:hypothetical protein